jgi:hypothetical protein
MHASPHLSGSAAFGHGMSTCCVGTPRPPTGAGRRSGRVYAVPRRRGVNVIIIRTHNTATDNRQYRAFGATRTLITYTHN